MRAAFLLCAALWAAAVAGCIAGGKAAGNIVAGQTPGAASGAGATFTGPANSAAPSSQTAQRRIGFYPPPTRESFRYAENAPKPAAAEIPAASGEIQNPAAGAEIGRPALVPIAPGAPVPAWIDEKTETTFGQHQDAAGIVRVALAVNQWGKARWLGVACLFFAYSGLLWAHGNPDGYPVVCWKVGAVGAFLVIADPSPWWACALIVPALFWLAQKLGWNPALFRP